MKRKEDFSKLTTAQFAALHEVNKRTLHYYDSIGLFSPETKGDNHYRYYDSAQSIHFEYILMLKELNMSIEEIKSYLDAPNAEDFIAIVDQKTKEIDQKIKKLKQTKELLQTKKQQLRLCETKKDAGIHLVQCPQETYLTAPFTFRDDEMKDLFSYIKKMWGIKQCRAGVGSYLSIDKIHRKDFEEYDGLFTPALDPHTQKDLFTKPAGTYLCTYAKGGWDKLPETYDRLLRYAGSHNLKLTGYAYEKGMNDFVIQSEEEYITQVMVMAQPQ